MVTSLTRSSHDTRRTERRVRMMPRDAESEQRPPARLDPQDAQRPRPSWGLAMCLSTNKDKMGANQVT